MVVEYFPTSDMHRTPPTPPCSPRHWHPSAAHPLLVVTPPNSRQRRQPHERVPPATATLTTSSQTVPIPRSTSISAATRLIHKPDSRWSAQAYPQAPRPPRR